MTHVYSNSGDFNNKFNPGVFSEEIRESSIASQFKGLRKIGDVVTVRFASTLVGAELTTLNSLISNHNPQTLFSGRRTNLVPINQSTKSNDYFTIGTYQYKGRLYEDVITAVEVLSYADTGVSSYDIRLYDLTNNTVLAELTGCTNTDIAVQNLGTISNLPLETSDLEIQGRKVGGGNGNRFIYFQSISIYFES